MSDLKTPKVGDSIGGYDVKRVEPLPNLQGTYCELEHRKTGARHIHIACPDDNNTFIVLFPTVPQDSTGVAHILEHVVLTGSERFPVRDPFFSMLPRSLKTFMNALTSSDWTCYPFSTRNEKDFFNLLNVYLDATMFPRLDEDSFKQEGHRFEFENLDDRKSGLRYKGVVFNEMKGAMATPASVIFRGVGKALFPGLTYENNSGGEPEDIPNLTWQQLRDFHAKHYHPSNAYFFTYGNLPLERVLEEIEDKALARFDKIEIDVSIPDVKRFEQPQEFELKYALAKEEDPDNKAQVLVAWVTTHVGDSFDVLALRVLEKVLLGNPGSPLQKALIESHMGEALADGTGFHTDFREAVFAAGLKGTSIDKGKAIESLVIDTLRSLVDGGVDQQQVDAAIHQLEIEQREVSNAGFPFSLKVFFELSGAYIYGGDPYRSLQFDEDVARLQEERSKGPFFENLIKRFLLDNNHRSTLTLIPDQKLEEQKNQAELDRLVHVEDSLTDDQVERIIEDARRLKAAQEGKQDVSSLPTLELSDIPMKFEDVPYEVEDIAGAKVGFFALPTNGISYIDVRADFATLPDELKDYLPIFAFAVPKMGAAGQDYVKMSSRIASYTGGIAAGAGVRPAASQSGDDSVLQGWTISGKALARNHQPFVSILTDFLTAVEFEPKRLQEVLSQFKAQREMFVVQAGMVYAMTLAGAKLSRPGALDERLSGLTQLRLLKEITADGNVEGVIDKLEQIKAHLLSREALKVCVTTEDKHVDEIRSLVKEMVEALPSSNAAGDSAALEPLALTHEARTTSVPVAFNAKVLKTVGYEHPDAPALAVLSHFMRATYLHRELREKGGAYGGQASADSERALFSFWSYRDPNIVRTYQVFESAVQEVLKGDIEADDLKEAILSVAGAVDPLESPDTKGRRRFFDDLAGYTLELRERFKRGLLQVTEADLRRVAETYLTSDRYAMATISNPDLIEKANDEMGGVFEVSAI